VDYVNVYRTSDISVAGQTAIVFNAITSGNIPYNTSNGQFTLTAGKTYKLTGNVNLNQANTALFTAWYNVTSGAYISPGARVSNGSSASYGSNQVEIVFTPTVTTIVELRNNLGSATTVAGAAIGSVNGVASQATIVQLGSSAVIAGVYPGVWSTYIPIYSDNGGVKTKANSTYDLASYKVEGKTITLNYRYSSAGTGGGSTAGAGIGRLSLPAGVQFDLTKMTLDANTSSVGIPRGSQIGTAFATFGGGGFLGMVTAFSATEFGVNVQLSGWGSQNFHTINGAFDFTAGSMGASTNNGLSVTITAPIV
jgi:hypothetical protein